mmetsp:Transcript_7723/g.47889  ORF Transcript_7723/g.47889 Transcript_7723/m.47889 type:complete len:475 (-) Transcript_7723:181-1605(-)
MTDQSLDGPGSRVPQCTDGVPFNLFGDLLEHVDLFQPCVALFHPLHDVPEPPGALPAGRALATGFVLVKIREPGNGIHHVCRLVHHNDRGRAQTRLLRLEIVKVHERRVAHRLGEQRYGRSTRYDSQKVIPSTSDSAAVPVDQLSEGDAHLFFHRARLVDVPTDAEELGPVIVLSSEAREPARPSTQDGRRHGDRFYIGDCGRAPVQAHACWEGRLQTRLSLLAFQAFQQGGLFSADVGPSTIVDEEIVVVPAAAGVFPQETRVVGFLPGLLQSKPFVDVLSADVNVADAGTHAYTCQEAAFQQLVRIVSHDLAILARSWLRFVRVDDEVRRSSVRSFGHEAPFQSGWEARTSSSTQSRRLDFVDDPISSHFDQFLGLVPIATLSCTLQERIVLSVQVGEDSIFVWKAAEAGLFACVGREAHDAGRHEAHRCASAPALLPDASRHVRLLSCRSVDPFRVSHVRGGFHSTTFVAS